MKEISCTNCAHINSSDATECEECGTELETRIKVCTNCGKHNPLDTWNCEACGSTLSVDSAVEAADAKPEPVRVSAAPETTTSAEIQEEQVPQEAPKIYQPKNRGGCLTAWLIVAIIVNAIYAFVSLSQLDTYFLTDTLRTVLCIGAVLNILNVVFAIAIFSWKRWGVYGYAIAIGLSILINLFIGAYLYAVVGLIGPVIFYFLIRPVWDQME